MLSVTILEFDCTIFQTHVGSYVISQVAYFGQGFIKIFIFSRAEPSSQFLLKDLPYHLSVFFL